MVAHPGWILEKVLCVNWAPGISAATWKALEVPELHHTVICDWRVCSNEIHRDLSGSDGQRKSFLSRVISALLYNHFHQVTLPWSICLAFHSFPSKIQVRLTQVLKCYLPAHSVEPSDTTYVKRFPFSSATSVLPLAQLSLCHWRVIHSLRVNCQVLCC